MFLILISLGYLGLRLVRNVLLEQWQETAIAKLQQTAHHVDMQLMRPKEMLRLLQGDPMPDMHLQLVIDQLRSLDGVVQVNTNRTQLLPDNINTLEHSDAHMRGMRHHQMEKQKLGITAPKYDKKLKSETVSLVSDFTDWTGQKSGSIEVVISFNTLIDEIVKAPWWKSNKAFLINRDGDILAGTSLV